MNSVLQKAMLDTRHVAIDVALVALKKKKTISSYSEEQLINWATFEQHCQSQRTLERISSYSEEQLVNWATFEQHCQSQSTLERNKG